MRAMPVRNNVSLSAQVLVSEATAVMAFIARVAPEVMCAPRSLVLSMFIYFDCSKAL